MMMIIIATLMISAVRVHQANDAADPDDKVDKDEDHSVTRAISSEVFHIPNVIPQLNEMQL